MAVNTITSKDLITEARAVPIFRGDDTYELSHFIRETETIIGLTPDQGLKAYLLNILMTKIQGPAAISIRRLETGTWDQVKNQLKRSFGVQQPYLKLKEEADSIKFYNVSQYYYDLVKVLDKLNLKYRLDDDSPTEFNTQNNEKSILEKFLNKLPRSDSMFLRIKNVETLEEAFFELLQTGINDNSASSQKYINHNNKKNKKYNSDCNHNNRSNNSYKNNSINNNFDYNRQLHRNNYNNSFPNRQPQYHENYQKNPSGYFRNQSGNFHNQNTYSRRFRNDRNYDRAGEAMDVDVNNIEKNFQSLPQITHYP